MQVLHADGTVRSGALFNTPVRASNILWITHITPHTVKVVLFASDPTNSAEIAVKLSFVSIVVQSANRAEVKSKFDPTFDAVGYDTLQFSALIALYLLNSFPV